MSLVQVFVAVLSWLFCSGKPGCDGVKPPPRYKIQPIGKPTEVKPWAPPAVKPPAARPD